MKKQFKNERVFSLTLSENLNIERLYYVNESYKSFLAVLTKSFSEVPSESGKEMIEHYRVLYQRSFVELNVARNALLTALLGEFPESMEYHFNFERSEVICRW